ncbi:unnamed protein product [Brassica oleracea var. botrytis]|uniref:Uncharacterized protein n=1 Tax=Brassica oleracea TaxID=3712 RepID=A0A3P6FGM6_BRAOL|nr:unnamed protein product [Brassica oleracea]
MSNERKVIKFNTAFIIVDMHPKHVLWTCLKTIRHAKDLKTRKKKTTNLITDSEHISNG